MASFSKSMFILWSGAIWFGFTIAERMNVNVTLQSNGDDTDAWSVFEHWNTDNRDHQILCDGEFQNRLAQGANSGDRRIVSCPIDIDPVVDYYYAWESIYRNYRKNPPSVPDVLVNGNSYPFALMENQDDDRFWHWTARFDLAGSPSTTSSTMSSTTTTTDSTTTTTDSSTTTDSTTSTDSFTSTTDSSTTTDSTTSTDSSTTTTDSSTSTDSSITTDSTTSTDSFTTTNSITTTDSSTTTIDSSSTTTDSTTNIDSSTATTDSTIIVPTDFSTSTTPSPTADSSSDTSPTPTPTSTGYDCGDGNYFTQEAADLWSSDFVGDDSYATHPCDILTAPILSTDPSAEYAIDPDSESGIAKRASNSVSLFPGLSRSLARRHWERKGRTSLSLRQDNNGGDGLTREGTETHDGLCTTVIAASEGVVVNRENKKGPLNQVIGRLTLGVTVCRDEKGLFKTDANDLSINPTSSLDNNLQNIGYSWVFKKYPGLRADEEGIRAQCEKGCKQLRVTYIGQVVEKGTYENGKKIGVDIPVAGPGGADVTRTVKVDRVGPVQQVTIVFFSDGHGECSPAADGASQGTTSCIPIRT